MNVKKSIFKGWDRPIKDDKSLFDAKVTTKISKKTMLLYFKMRLVYGLADIGGLIQEWSQRNACTITGYLSNIGGSIRSNRNHFLVIPIDEIEANP